jgi:phosphoglycerol transferase MdoB-like AlkP superfamily enzyme
MLKFFRINEYKVLAYRILLAYIFYFLARILFYLYNSDFLKVDSFIDFLTLCYYGLAFDTTAILYVNMLFIVFSILPLWKNTTSGYQKFLFWLYFTTNIFVYLFNFIDFIYYRYSLSRTTTAALEVIKHETNKSKLFFSFLFDYWHVWFILVLLSSIWIFLYKKIKLNLIIPTKPIPYFGFSIIAFLIISVLIIGGIRGGDFQKSTRPINLVDAGKHVKKINHSDIVLNTPFAIIRTLFSNSFKKTNFTDVNDLIIKEKVQPIKQYFNNPTTKPNVVVFILESYSREYIGAFNSILKIPNLKTHAPFLDSLSQHSLIFPNAFANGRQSIHGMSSVLAGIPAFKDAFTSSPYPKQKIESLVSTLESEGYNTSFFHGAANGSMGFQGFGNILGIDNYYGRTEFNDDAQYDGFWGIWDEPFLQFMKKTLDKKKSPFLATVFTVSSHEPYIIPEKYKNKFKEGKIPMHKCAEYTDFALKRFFNESKKSTWFENTIFVLVADHGNQVFYDDYNQQVNRFAVPIIIYKPNSKYVGIDNDLAQQIDIYPTILDMIGYKKPFRSWGRSLIDKNGQVPFVINSTGEITQFLKGNYICIFDGKKATGFYDKNDRALITNLIANRNQEMNDLELQCKAFIQDYMNRIIDRKMYFEN